jgi:hypothetical protein
MATLTFSSTKSFFTKLTDIFQKRDTTHVPMHTSYVATEPVATQEEPLKSKLNINLNDLKVISTALLHYRRSLSKQGDMDRAEGVGRIDKQFFELIQALETKNAA